MNKFYELKSKNPEMGIKGISKILKIPKSNLHRWIKIDQRSIKGKLIRNYKKLHKNITFKMKEYI